MNFFFDNNLSPDLAHGLQHLRQSFGESIIHLRDRYPDNVADAEWLNELASEGGWSVISGDRFKKNPAERNAVRNPRLNVFIMAKGFVKKRSWERTKIMIAQWEDISATASATQGGVYEVRTRGKIMPYQP